MTEEKIEFFAQAGKFVAVKKLKITPTVPELEKARFLLSVKETINRKFWDFLKKDLPIEELEDIAGEVCGAEKGKKGWKLKGRVSEDRMIEMIAKAKSTSVTKKINALVQGKASREVAKGFVVRKVMEVIGFPIELDAKLLEKMQDEVAKQ